MGSYHSVAGEYGISEDDKEGKLGGPTQTANALASSLGDTSSAASLYLLLRAAQVHMRPCPSVPAADPTHSCPFIALLLPLSVDN